MTATNNKIHLVYPKATMFQMIERTAGQYPDAPAFDMYGRITSYRKFLQEIETAAAALYAYGIKKNDRVTICMPNCPQAMVCFYAVNRIGAVCNMVHPQSAQKEITYYLNVSESRLILVLDMFYEKVEKALGGVDHPVTILVSRMQEALPPHLAFFYMLKAGRPYLKYPNTPHAVKWKEFLKKGKGTVLPPAEYEEGRTAAILYSGGTTGYPKGICLTDKNFNALAMQARTAIEDEMGVGLKMLSCMPLFHGFGLGINLHLILMYGACCILMPNFNGKTYADMLLKKKPNFIAGVPTIFEALLHIPELEGADLGFLKGVFCGGDSLSVGLKKKIDTFLKEHNADIQIREGYGLTECVTASCLTPKNTYREGSIGLPFPDMEYRIVRPGTEEILPPGKEGEIILRGPSVMTGYLNNPEETAETLRKLPDGHIWLYTGDLGYMDEDGYVYFRQRIKRMIISNGYNIYPSQIENVIDSCPEVSYSCVIGVKDPRRMQRVRAYIVLKDGYEPSDALQEKIMNELRLHIAEYALPKEMVFRKDLEKTLVGKVAYRILEEEAEREEEENRAESA